jgi:WD40 repeat protein
VGTTQETFDRVLIDPTPAALGRALSGAVKAANGSFKSKTIAWPAPDLADFRRQLAANRSGMRGWHGGVKRSFWEGRSQVIVAWWSDRLDRKHVRVLGGHGPTLCPLIRHGMAGLQLDVPLPLEQVYPQHIARCDRGHGTELLALCDCGALGTPDELAWMGTCCGPCHDRRAEGVPACAPLTFRFSETDSARGLVFSPDGEQLAGWSWCSVWVRHLAEEMQDQAPLSEPSPGLISVRFSASDNCFMIASDTTITAWKPGEIVTGSWRHSEICYSEIFSDGVALAPDGTLVAVVNYPDDQGEVAVRATAGGTVRRIFPLVGCESVDALVFSPDCRRLAVSRPAQDRVQVWEVELGQTVADIPCRHRLAALAFSPDGMLLAGAGAHLSTAGIFLADLSRNEALPALELPPGRSFEKVAFAPTGRLLVAGGRHNILSLWDLDTDRGRLDLQWGDSREICMAWSPDGRWLATSDNHGDVRLWSGPALRALLAGVARSS